MPKLFSSVYLEPRRFSSIFSLYFSAYSIFENGRDLSLFFFHSDNIHIIHFHLLKNSHHSSPTARSLQSHVRTIGHALPVTPGSSISSLWKWLGSQNLFLITKKDNRRMLVRANKMAEFRETRIINRCIWNKIQFMLFWPTWYSLW